MRTFVYRNLQNGKWSIQQKFDGRMQVVAYADHVEISGVTVKQNNNMLAKIRLNNRRKVCTMVEAEHLTHAVNIVPFKGRTFTLSGERQPTGNRVVTFNPHIDDSLVYDHIGSGIEYTGSDYATFTAEHKMIV